MTTATVEAIELGMRSLNLQELETRTLTARNEVYLPNDQDALLRLIYLTTFDNPTGRSPLTESQVEQLRHMYERHQHLYVCRAIANKGFYLMMGGIIVAFISIVVFSKALEKKPTLVKISIGGMCVGVVVAVVAIVSVIFTAKDTQKELQKQVRDEFLFLCKRLVVLKDEDKKLAEHLVGQMKIDNIKTQLLKDCLGRNSTAEVCGHLEAVVKYVQTNHCDSNDSDEIYSFILRENTKKNKITVQIV